MKEDFSKVYLKSKEEALIKTRGMEIHAFEEITESYRRKMVNSGEWTEQESRTLLQNIFDKNLEKYPSQSYYRIEQREKDKAMDAVFKMRNPSSIQEKEYYFDEGLVSLSTITLNH